MNWLAIVIMVFLPWLLFLTIYLTCATTLRYDRPQLAWNVWDIGVLIVIITWVFAARSWRRKCANDPYRQPSWLLYAGISLTIAMVCGTIFGDMNFWWHVQPAHDIEGLNVYGNNTHGGGINPAFTKGEEVMDAGRIYFREGAKLDESKSMAFRNLDLFCVAPITMKFLDQPLKSYDYWAVGVNCCSSHGSKFACGEFANPHAKAGLRLMRDDQRAFFRLAVQQAEIEYGIKAEYPLFFEWMQDPSSLLTEWHEEAYRWHKKYILGYFVFNAFCVICAVIFFSKLGRY